MSQSRGGHSRLGRRPFVFGAVALGVAASLALAGCAPGQSSSSSSSASGVSTKVTGKVTLTMWGGEGAYDPALIAAFEKQHPNIKINFEGVPDGDVSALEPKVASSSTAPDLIIYPTGAASYVKDGSLANLDAYAQAYGWDKLPAAQLSPYRVEDGVVGKGPLYGFSPSVGTMTGVFYNRKLAEKLGITAAPANLAQFQADLAKAKAAGITPIVCANSIGLLGHVWNLLLGDYMGAAAVNKITFDDPSASVNTKKGVEATSKLAEWLKDGYFNSDLNALDQNTSYADFMAGQDLFTIQGSWVLQPMQQMVSAGNLGFFPFPAVTTGGQETAMSTAGIEFSIPTKSKNKNAAAVFLNWTQSAAAAQVAYENGYSVTKTNSTSSSTTVGWNDSVEQQLANGYAKVASGNGITNWVVNATAGLGTAAVNPGLQELAAAKVTPQSFLSTVQQTYQAEIK